ncbi:MAG: TetR family transcriptional regulator [Kiritimatiellae bacterium]|jgi:AcrR family transcriptional regulator|nr:TetR family transcriptional regulator [Kiritimatiellia bacterium]
MKKGKKTKQHLLDSACELFAKQGFDKTTMRNITDAAETNVAAVNYHFGDKENLYFESFKHAAEIATEQISVLENNTTDPKVLLEKALYLRLKGITSETPNSWLMRMFHHENSKPYRYA